MSNLHNTQILEDAQADYDTFAAKREWRNCEAVIDSLREQGFNHEADILRKDMLQTQFRILDKQDFLDEYGATEDEVEIDGTGREYIMVESEDEGGVVRLNRKYLPQV